MIEEFLFLGIEFIVIKKKNKQKNSFHLPGVFYVLGIMASIVFW